MSRRARTVVLAGFAALATAGLTACGSDSLDGSAHAVAPAAATAAPNAAPVAAPAPVAPAPAAARPVGGPGSGGAAPAGGSGSGVVPAGGANNGSGGGSGSGGHDSPPAPAAKVTSLRVVQQPTCPVHGTPDAPYSSPGTDVVIAWSVSGARGAAIAADNPGVYGAYGSEYPPSGTLALPFGCDGQGTTSHTYTVWPAGTHDVSRTITVSAHSDG
jgi:hypothetical protein